MTRLAAFLLSTVLWIGTAGAQPAPAEIVGAVPQANLAGEGSFRYLAWKIYVARLWTSGGATPFDVTRYAEQPFALELRYERDLRGASIAERSLDEMKKQGPIAEADATRWLEEMKRAFPDVTTGDRLLGVNDGHGGVRFFLNGRQTASLSDARFSARFFGIWLLPTTSAPSLRNALTGADKARP